jgi:response regulator RpfG family c-di-GMP phosphodiesterase
VGQGTGLGLSTVYGIVKQNHGHIEVYSESGQGTTFKIYLPQSQESQDNQTVRHSKEISKGTETVLLVEDEEAILKLANVVLQRYGYKVLIAGTPKKALAVVQEYKAPIHLLITDVVMPEMNGWELKKQLQNLLPELKVLFISGYASNIVADRGVLEKDVKFLQKPFSVESLTNKVREVLNQK